MELRYDPLHTLMEAADPALRFFVRRDFLGETAGCVEDLWELPAAARLVRRQRADGAWQYPGKQEADPTQENYNLVETYRSLRVLVEQYGFTRQHPAISKAAGYLLSCQTSEGDLRGILGNQYMPYYHGAILELLVKAGYAGDPNVERGLNWLLQVRQADGAWMVPAQVMPSKGKTSEFWRGLTLPFDPARPSCHLATGMALRGLAAHPAFRQDPRAQRAGRWLMGRLFKKDTYNDRAGPEYWFKFQYPFWWTTLLTALDTLGKLGFTRQEVEIQRGLTWFQENQQPDGLWQSAYGNPKEASERLWIGLAVCRMLARF